MIKILITSLLFLISLPCYSNTLDSKDEDSLIKPINVKFRTNINYIGTNNFNSYKFLNISGLDLNYYLGNKFSLGLGLGAQSNNISILAGVNFLPYVNVSGSYYFSEPTNFSPYIKTELIFSLAPYISQVIGLEKRFSNGLTISGDVGVNFLILTDRQVFPSVGISVGYAYIPLKLKNKT